jgi:hypothetical protein
LLAVQVADQKNFLPAVRAQAQKAGPRNNHNISYIKILLQIVEMAADCGCFAAVAEHLLLGSNK